MVVCHCNAVNDAHIRALAAEGALTADAIAAVCGAGDRCGNCLPTVLEVLQSLDNDTPTAASTAQPTRVWLRAS
ncbi:MAG: (2Fe-2S)-binding protein [Actinomycetota bacterium]